MTALATIRIDPADYDSWHSTRLGTITESLEQRVIQDLMGPVDGADVLDAGCGDGALACALASRGLWPRERRSIPPFLLRFPDHRDR